MADRPDRAANSNGGGGTGVALLLGTGLLAALGLYELTKSKCPPGYTQVNGTCVPVSGAGSSSSSGGCQPCWTGTEWDEVRGECVPPADTAGNTAQPVPPPCLGQCPQFSPGEVWAQSAPGTAVWAIDASGLWQFAGLGAAGIACAAAQGYDTSAVKTIEPVTRYNCPQGVGLSCD